MRAKVLVRSYRDHWIELELDCGHEISVLPFGRYAYVNTITCPTCHPEAR